jgi:uncharacterized membrane protein YbhN (UPF0104 family)
VVDTGLRLVRREPLPGPLSRTTVVTALGWAVLGALGLGVHAWLLARGLGLHGAPVARSLGGFVLAWAAGFVVPLAPAGGGVREVVLYAAFRPVLGSSGATALAGVSRLLLTVIDVAAGGVAALVRPAAPVDTREPHPEPSSP